MQFSNRIELALSKSQKSPLAVFVGAGISISSGLPGYVAFSQRLIKHLTAIKDPETQLDLAKQIQPEILLQVLFEEYGDQVLQLFDWFNLGSPSTNHKLIANLLSVGCTVFTTNIDCLIEKACEELSVNYQCFTSEAQYADIWAQGTHPNLGGKLFKLHGSIGQPVEALTEYDKIQFTRHQVGKGLTRFKQKTLEHSLSNSDFIFLGYSANDRFSVQPLIRRTKSNFKIYWVQHKAGAIWNETESWESTFAECDKMIQSAANGQIGYGDLDWEAISIVQIAREGENSNRIVHASGDVDHLVKLISTEEPEQASERQEVFVEPPKIEIGGKRKEIVASKILAKASLDKLAENFTNKVKDSKDPIERAAANQIAGTLITQPLSMRLESLTEAINDFASNGAELNAIECIIDKANILRRLNRADEAFQALESAKQRAESIESATELKACFLTRISYLKGLTGLNSGVTGLELLKTIDHCDEAIAHAGISRNKDLLAEAMNAKALIIQALIRQRRFLLESAVDVLTKALDINTSIGDFDGCYKQYRNLGLVNKELADIANADDNDLDFKRFRHQAIKNYENAGHILDLQPTNAEAKLVDLKLRRAQAYVDVEHSSAIKLATELKNQFLSKGDFHGRARAIHVLLTSETDPDELFEHICELHSIYSYVTGIPLGISPKASIPNEQAFVNVDFEKQFWGIPIKIANAFEFLGVVKQLVNDHLGKLISTGGDQPEYAGLTKKWQTLLAQNSNIVEAIKSEMQKKT